MEKLIELLNEYSKKKHNLAMRELNWELWLWFHYLNYWSSYSEMLMISKKYEFIKWLVENEKIDIKALIVKGEMRSWWDFDNKKWNEESGEEIWNKYYSELCLMLLSIQDEPIEFLVSILK